MFKIGIIGATGYTGSELVRILVNHPEAEIKAITSESNKGKNFSDIHPQFKNIVDTNLISVRELNTEELDIVFLALPHGTSMEYARDLFRKNVRIIDLSGDFRLSSADIYKEWYKKEHSFDEGFKYAAFGLPELFGEKIRDSRLTANPGCFPTGAILALAPLVKNGLIDLNKIIVDSKTGITGAGIKPSATSHFPNVNENFKPYGLKTHRHTIEMEEQLSAIGKSRVTIQFTPHLLPVDRGILTTTYSTPLQAISERELNEIYRGFYGGQKFIRILNTPPELKNVRGTNFVDIYPSYDERTNNIMVFSAIDNLVKGAAGQAVQNMNIMLQIDPGSGLNHMPIRP